MSKSSSGTTIAAREGLFTWANQTVKRNSLIEQALHGAHGKHRDRARRAMTRQAAYQLQ